jgi:serine/threonine protein kinase
MAEGGLQGQAEFDTEQQLLARLSHGHLVRLLGVVRSAQPPLRCLLYELMPGGNVEEQLASEVRLGGSRGGGMLCSSLVGTAQCFTHRNV